MKITDDLIASFVVGDVKYEEFRAVLEAAKTNPETAEKVIMGLLAVRFMDKIFADVDKAIEKAIAEAAKEAMKKAAEIAN